MQVYIHICLLIVFLTIFSAKPQKTEDIEELLSTYLIRTRRAIESAAMVTPLQLKIKKTYYDEETTNKIKQLKDLFLMA